MITEPVGPYRPVAQWLKDFGFGVHMVHVGRLPKERRKSDKRDAKRLLHLWRGGTLEDCYLPRQEVQRLRDLARLRMFLGQERQRLRIKMKLDLYQHGRFVTTHPVETVKGRATLEKTSIPEIRSTYTLWKHVDEEIQDFEERIQSDVADSAGARLLRTAPGIVAFTALLILAEVVRISVFYEGRRRLVQLLRRALRAQPRPRFGPEDP